MRILLKLSCCNFKIRCFKFKIFYVSLMITRKNLVVITQRNMMRSQSIYIQKYIKTQTQDRRMRNKQQWIHKIMNQKTLNKIAIVSPCLSKITLNGLHFPIKRHRMAEYNIKKLTICFPRNSL